MSKSPMCILHVVERAVKRIERGLAMLFMKSETLSSGSLRGSGEPPLEQQRVLQTAILGCPNAGKSTLTNKLVGFKVPPASF